VGFEPTISAGERPQTYALDRAATGTGKRQDNKLENCCIYQVGDLFELYDDARTF